MAKVLHHPHNVSKNPKCNRERNELKIEFLGGNHRANRRKKRNHTKGNRELLELVIPAKVHDKPRKIRNHVENHKNPAQGFPPAVRCNIHVVLLKHSMLKHIGIGNHWCMLKRRRMAAHVKHLVVQRLRIHRRRHQQRTSTAAIGAIRMGTVIMRMIIPMGALIAAVRHSSAKTGCWAARFRELGAVVACGAHVEALRGRRGVSAGMLHVIAAVMHRGHWRRHGIELELALRSQGQPRNRVGAFSAHAAKHPDKSIAVFSGKHNPQEEKRSGKRKKHIRDPHAPQRHLERILQRPLEVSQNPCDTHQIAEPHNAIVSADCRNQHAQRRNRANNDGWHRPDMEPCEVH
eukprot:comp23581_c0_seq1/m.58995 comp23581_c0_seq1/g.58995  ORF comp23581_c0_seq1/g.58995 comp23581_c0_seq1/m.58995 type:complete len:347 (-) comp23581_c0_seq1:13-1053(-)